MAAYKTRAISLKTAPFAEADKMVTLFTRDYGKIRVLAKSARKVPSSLGGKVETFTYADYFIAKCRSLDIVSQCQVIETFQGIREHPDKLYPGLYMLKLVNLGTSEGQHYPELFDLLLRALLELKDRAEGGRIVKEFMKKFVLIEGIHREGIDPSYSLTEHLERDLSVW